MERQSVQAVPAGCKQDEQKKRRDEWSGGRKHCVMDLDRKEQPKAEAFHDGNIKRSVKRTELGLLSEE